MNAHFKKFPACLWGGGLIQEWKQALIAVPLPLDIHLRSTYEPNRSSAIQTQQCDRNARRNNLRFLHGTATYILFCFVFFFFACLLLLFFDIIILNMPLLVTSLPPAPCLPCTLYFYLLFFATRKKEVGRAIIGCQRRQETGKIPNCTESERLRTPKLTV